MRTLTLSTGSFDQVNTFTVAHPRADRLPMTATLHKDYQHEGDGVFWAMQKSACVKSAYTEADYKESDRLQSETPIQPGEIVLIDGKEHVCRVLGNYSDCAIFDPV